MNAIRAQKICLDGVFAFSRAFFHMEMYVPEVTPVKPAQGFVSFGDTWGVDDCSKVNRRSLSS